MSASSAVTNEHIDTAALIAPSWSINFIIIALNAPTARLKFVTRQVGLRACSGQFHLPNHTHLPINHDSGIREDSGLNIPLRGQLRTWLGLTEFPVMPIARPPNESPGSIETEGLDATHSFFKWP